MNKYVSVLVLLLSITTARCISQATITLSLDSAGFIDPVVMFDTVRIGVSVSVTNDLGNPDTVSGDIFYYYWTDSMQAAAISPRILEQDLVVETITSGFLDTISVEILPNEIKTNPLNLIVIWPAMINTDILDSDSVVIQAILEGFLNTPPVYPVTKGNIIFPCPAKQFLYIRPEELSSLVSVALMDLQGKYIATYKKENLEKGFINIDLLAPGTYTVIITYMNGMRFTTKVLKE